ncbi:MAG TPA: ATP-binding protein, partial [Steroidobacteraceae bacterium]|nr:ATP-binding protein [Steroidobacteraceae bacterium]
VPAALKIGDTIKRAVRAQETIVNDMLDLSRVRTGKLRLYRELADVKALVERLTQTVQPEILEKGIHLEAAAPPESLVCNVDPVRIEQVVWNLLGNAVKFTPKGGSIRIAMALDGTNVRIEFADTGAGISPDALKTIFELFGQSESVYTGQRRVGLGIGLALVRELVEAHGGRVDAVSPGVGRGSTFTVWLPLARESAGSPQADHPAFAGYSGRIILIVDDDSDSRMALAAVLETEGAVVETAASGAEALQKLAAGHYDLLLSDIGMDEMSGIDLIRAVRQQPSGADLLSVAITGFGRESDVQRALEAGFDAHIAKPVSIERLQELLQRRWNA